MKTVFSSLRKIKSLTHLLVPTICLHRNHSIVYVYIQFTRTVFLSRVVLHVQNSMDFVLVFVTIQPHIARRGLYINIACVEHIETD